MSTKLDERRKNFKKGIDGDDSRRKREENTIELRNNRREEMIQKRRMKNDGTATNEQAGNEENTNINFGDLSREEMVRNIPNLVKQLSSGVISQQLAAVTEFRKMLSIESLPPINEVLACGVLAFLSSCLTQAADAYPMLQFEAAWAITNIASGTTSNTDAVVQGGNIPLLVRLLNSENEDVKEQAVWALGNIAGDSVPHRDAVLEANGMNAFLELLSQQNVKLSLQRNATWAISNLCRGKPQPDFDLISMALPRLNHLLHSSDEEVIVDSLWAISYLSDDSGPNNEKIQAVLNSGSGSRLVELLLHKSPNVKTPALRSVGNIVTGDDLQTSVMINCGLLGAIPSLLSHSKRSIRKEACWTISNVTAGNADHLDAVIKSNIVPNLIQLLQSGEFDVKKEACWALSNATSSGRPDHLKYLIDKGLVAPLCEMFNSPDSKIILVALEALENLLKVAQKEADRNGSKNKVVVVMEDTGALDCLEKLQEHENDQFFNKSVHLLKQYFGGEEVDSGNVQNSNFSFSQQVPVGGFNF